MGLTHVEYGFHGGIFTTEVCNAAKVCRESDFGLRTWLGQCVEEFEWFSTLKIPVVPREIFRDLIEKWLEIRR
jgi:hypothetical protein